MEINLYATAIKFNYLIPASSTLTSITVGQSYSLDDIDHILNSLPSFHSLKLLDLQFNYVSHNVEQIWEKILTIIVKYNIPITTLANFYPTMAELYNNIPTLTCINKYNAANDDPILSSQSYQYIRRISFYFITAKINEFIPLFQDPYSFPSLIEINLPKI